MNSSVPIRKLGLVSLLAFGFANALFGQIKIEGVVVDETDQPLPYVVISALDQSSNTYSNTAGEFELEIVQPDSVSFQWLGYVKKTIYVYSDTTLRIALEPKPNESFYWIRPDPYISYGLASGVNHTPYGLNLEGSFINPFFESPLLNLGVDFRSNFDGNSMSQASIGINRLIRLFNRRWDFKIERRHRSIATDRFDQNLESWIFSQNESLFGLTFFPGVGVISDRNKTGIPEYFITKLGLTLPIVPNWNAYAEVLTWNGNIEFYWFTRFFVAPIELTFGTRHFDHYNEINIGLSYLVFKRGIRD